MSADHFIIHTDGGARGNPGPAAIGVVIHKNGKHFHHFGKTIGETTNNVAEYTAVTEAFRYLKSQNISTSSHLLFVLDSKLVVNQLNCLYKIKDAKLRELCFQIRQWEQEVGEEIVYTRVPREQNREADFLVNQHLDNNQ